MKVSGIMNKSTEIMKICNSMVKLGQFNQTMQNMSMEMTKVWSYQAYVKLNLIN